MSETAFRVQRTSAGTMELVTLFGELDLAGRPQLDAVIDEVLAAKPPVLALDLRPLRFVDATGIRAFIRTERNCSELGLRFLLVRGDDAVKRTLSVCGLESYFETVDAPDCSGDVDAAAAA